MENLKHTKMIWPVKAPFMIAYRDKLTGALDLRPYIDLQWKIKIWGISFNGLVFKITHEAGTDWYNAKLCNDKSKATIPTTEELDKAYTHKEGFNEIIDFLKTHGVNAEPWQSGWYWSTEEQGDDAVVMDMECGKVELIAKRIKNGYIRLISRNNFSQKPATVRYPLAYLHNGQFEISYTLYLSRLNELWGIQLGNNGYFCLTEESHKMQWCDGMALAEKLSTDKVKYSLPRKEAFDEVVRYRDEVNNALVKLEAYGVHTDLWLDKGFGYLTSSENGDYFATCLHEIIPKDRPCTCRLFARNKGGTIVI